MSARVVSSVWDDGRLVARKRSRNAADAVRLRHEADVLRAARHPGVIELVACDAEGADVVLTTEFAGTHSLETLTPTSVEHAVGIVAAVATTVADLHDMGIVHGRIEPSHVLIGGGGRPVLCGFAGGGRVGSAPPAEPPRATPGTGSATSSETTLTPQVDVHGLGCLLRTLVVHDDGIEPIPDRRWRFERVKQRWSGFHVRALLTLADRATDDVPSRRPPARRFAQDVLDTVPAAALVVPGRDQPARHERDARVPLKLPAVAAALALGMVGLFVFRGSGSAASPKETASTTDSESIPTSGVATTVERVAPTCLGGSNLVTDDLDGDGCGDPVHIEDDRIVVVGGQRFTAGEPGDRVAVGDWNCDGKATVAVLRPSTGAVFVFDTWAIEGTDVSVAPVAITADAVELQTREHDNGCAALVVVRRDGTAQEVT